VDTREKHITSQASLKNIQPAKVPSPQMIISTAQLQSMSLAALKERAFELGLTPSGNKSFKATWVAAIENFQTAIGNIKESEALEIITEAADVIVDQSVKAAIVAIAATRVISRQLSSESAKDFYTDCFFGVLAATITAINTTYMAGRVAGTLYHAYQDDSNRSEFKEAIAIAIDTEIIQPLMSVVIACDHFVSQVVALRGEIVAVSHALTEDLGTLAGTAIAPWVIDFSDLIGEVKEHN
jgi:hypothetical protein